MWSGHPLDKTYSFNLQVDRFTILMRYHVYELHQLRKSIAQLETSRKAQYMNCVSYKNYRNNGNVLKNTSYSNIVIKLCYVAWQIAEVKLYNRNLISISMWQTETSLREQNNTWRESTFLSPCDYIRLSHICSQIDTDTSVSWSLADRRTSWLRPWVRSAETSIGRP